MRSNNRKGAARSSTMTSVLIAGLPFMFIAGLFVGFQLWGKPNVQADQQANTPQRYEILISADDPYLGPEDAPVTIVEFSDYQCPYCQRYHSETFDQIIDTYGDQIRYVYKDLPLTSIHPDAAPAANAAHCAQEQGVFWPYHRLLFSGQLGLSEDAFMAYADSLGLNTGAFATCLAENRYMDVVMEDTSVLTALNAPLSTPTFFINGQYVAGAQPFSTFAQLIDAELEAVN